MECCRIFIPVSSSSVLLYLGQSKFRMRSTEVMAKSKVEPNSVLGTFGLPMKAKWVSAICSIKCCLMFPCSVVGITVPMFK